MLKGLTNILPKNFEPSFLGFCFVMMWSSNNAQNIEKQEDSLVVSKTEPTEIKDNPQAAAIDQKWFDLLSDTYRFQEQQHALNDPWDSIPLHDSLWSTETFKSRLALLDQKTPFHITYNASLEKIVRNYLKNRRPQLERLMGVSHYYFPMFEEVFAQYEHALRRSLHTCDFLVGKKAIIN